MAQANPEAEGDDDIDTCRVAMEAAFQKGMNFCDTRETRVEVLGKIVGIQSPDFDVDEVLAEGPAGTDDLTQTRRWVLSRAEEIMAGGDDEPLDAINQAWGEVGDHIDAAGVEEDDEPEPEEEPTDEGI